MLTSLSMIMLCCSVFTLIIRQTCVVVIVIVVIIVVAFYCVVNFVSLLDFLFLHVCDVGAGGIG